MIYKHIPHNSGVFTYDTTMKRKIPHWLPLESWDTKYNRLFENEHGNPGFAFDSGGHRFAILSTCRTICSEAMPILYAATPLGIWRPMLKYYGHQAYPVFVERVFSSLPIHATKHIRILQLQGELWQKNTPILFTTALAKLPCLKILEIGIDPYYDMADRAKWFDGVHQSWLAISDLYLVAQRLSYINITVSPPSNGVRIVVDGDRDWSELSGAAYQQYIWLQFQVSVLRYELCIYGALVHKDARQGMDFFGNLLSQRTDLGEILQARKLVRRYIDGTVEFRLEAEREWLREITGRRLEVDEKEKRVNVFSEDKAGVKWCDFNYESRPRGLVEL
jgi:hypothetical protein